MTPALQGDETMAGKSEGTPFTVKPQPTPETHDLGPFHRIGQDEETRDWWWETLDEGCYANGGSGLGSRDAAVAAIHRAWEEYWA